jgi:hypothetical protein
VAARDLPGARHGDDAQLLVVPDPMTFQIEKAMFLKNITMLGGALVISYFGAGPLSLDALISQRKGFKAVLSPVSCSNLDARRE